MPDTIQPPWTYTAEAWAALSDAAKERSAALGHRGGADLSHSNYHVCQCYAQHQQDEPVSDAVLDSLGSDTAFTIRVARTGW